jgi:hypothetical protein
VPSSFEARRSYAVDRASARVLRFAQDDSACFLIPPPNATNRGKQIVQAQHTQCTESYMWFFPKWSIQGFVTALLRCIARVRSRYWQVSKIPMAGCCFRRSLRVLALALSCCSAVSLVQAQGAKQTVPLNRIPDTDFDHIKERNEWFFRGRLIHGMASAELRRRAYQAKLQMRTRHAAALATAHEAGQAALSSGLWTPLGPMPSASDASGNGTQDYRQVSGRATAIAIDPADPTGNTIYIGARKVECGNRPMRPKPRLIM